MINKRNYNISHATMIDSECDRSLPIVFTPQPYANNSSNFYRSPLRDRQNKMNLSNTPLRSGKQSLSPLRLRKTDNNNAVGNSIRATKRKPLIDERMEETKACFNHQQKLAKFFVETSDQLMFYCEKCAILLASQGFPVKKLQNSSGMQQSSFCRNKQNNARKGEIQQFMSSLQMVEKQLKGISSNLDQNLNSAESQLQQQLTKIEDYYQQFYEILNEHKKRVLQEIKEEYGKNNASAFQMKRELKQAVEQTESMKKDILQSWDDIIFVAQEHQYRPVINTYVEKLQTYQSLTSKGNSIPQLRVRKLNFINTDAACEALQKGLEVEWQDQEYQEDQQREEYDEEAPSLQQKDSQMAKYSKQSDLPQNPVEFLEKDEKFVKSSLKNLVGLFSSFQE